MKFDIHTIYHEGRPLSYSALSSFAYDPEQWYQTYIKGVRQESRELAFGNWVDNKLQVDPSFLPQVERYPILQHGMRVSFDSIPMIGFADGWDPEELVLADYKTGKKAWDKKRADETKQLTAYSFFLYLIDHIKPEDLKLRIVWLPTAEKGDFTIGFKDDPVVPYVFETKRNMLQLLEFGQHVKDTLRDMELFAQQKLDNE